MQFPKGIRKACRINVRLNTLLSLRIPVSHSFSLFSPPVLTGREIDIFFGVPPSFPGLICGDLRRRLRRLEVLVLLDVEARRFGAVVVDMLVSSSSSSSSSLRRFSEIRSGGDPAVLVGFGDFVSSLVWMVVVVLRRAMGMSISISSSSASSSG